MQPCCPPANSAVEAPGRRVQQRDAQVSTTDQVVRAQAPRASLTADTAAASSSAAQALNECLRQFTAARVSSVPPAAAAAGSCAPVAAVAVGRAHGPGVGAEGPRLASAHAVLASPQGRRERAVAAPPADSALVRRAQAWGGGGASRGQPAFEMTAARLLTLPPPPRPRATCSPTSRRPDRPPLKSWRGWRPTTRGSPPRLPAQPPRHARRVPPPAPRRPRWMKRGTPRPPLHGRRRSAARS